MNFYLQASSAYWRGNKDRESLQRVYGISFPDQKRLKVRLIFWRQLYYCTTYAVYLFDLLYL